MAHDDQRMHGGDTAGLVPGRGHERSEEPVRLGGREPGMAAPTDEATPTGPVTPNVPTPDDEK